MKKYTNKISLVKNNRGVWDLDPFKGCNYGVKINKNGCYGICYAKKIAKFRGYNFGKLVYRDFKNKKHLNLIGTKIAQTSILPGVQPLFIRLGVMCDPSSDWNHTLKIVNQIKTYNPNIVIITKHWTDFTSNQLKQLKGLYINTSICALDTKKQIKHRLYWYNKLKKYCNSVLRVNTADFNNIKLIKLQDELLNNDNVIDNILRIPKNNILVKNGILNVKKHKFLNSEVMASKHDNNIYFSYCKDCKEQCGINLFK